MLKSQAWKCKECGRLIQGDGFSIIKKIFDHKATTNHQLFERWGCNLNTLPPDPPRRSRPALVGGWNGHRRVTLSKAKKIADEAYASRLARKIKVATGVTH